MTDYRTRAALMMEQQSERKWYEIQNKTGSKSARIRLYDEIGMWGTTAKEFVDELDALDVERIDLHINSVGGEVNDAVAIMNALHDHPAKITTIIDGVAASSASFIAMAGDEVVMNNNSELMVHEPFGLAMGNSADMKDLASRLDKEGDRIASIYAAKAGGTIAEWRDVMRAETWFSAQEAVDAKLADRIAASTDGTEAKNKHNFAIFNYAGRENAPKPPILNTKTPAATVDGQTKQKGPDMSALMDSLRKKLGIADESADEATVLAALDEALAERVEPVPQPQNSAAPEVKDLNQLKELAKAQGAVILDSGVWEEAQNKIQQGVEAAQKLRQQERDLVLDRAVEDGRIPPANRGYWASLYDKDPKGTGDVIASLKKNLVPVAAMGYALEEGNDLGEFASLFPKGA